MKILNTIFMMKFNCFSLMHYKYISFHPQAFSKYFLKQSKADRQCRLNSGVNVQDLLTILSQDGQMISAQKHLLITLLIPSNVNCPPSPLLSEASMLRTRVQAVVVDPEVVFVASLMKADAPALVASFQCDFTLQTEDDGSQNMKANLRELKVLACPFIRKPKDKAVTTVRSHPCQMPVTAGHLWVHSRLHVGSRDLFNSWSNCSPTHHFDSLTGTETLLSHLGNENPAPPTSEQLCDSGGSHYQG